MTRFSRILSLVCCTAVVFMALAVPASAACRERCLGSYSTSPNGTDPSDWGMGSSCTAADADFYAHAASTADFNCFSLGHNGACNVNYVITTPCFWTGSMFQTDGYATHSCLVEVCIETNPQQ